jgi:hypothetical protein
MANTLAEERYAKELAARILEQGFDAGKAVLEWLETATAVRAAVLRARRQLAERKRRARRDDARTAHERLADHVMAIALAGAQQASGNKIADLGDWRVVPDACQDVRNIDEQIVKQIGTGIDGAAARGEVMTWTAAAAGYARRLGREVTPYDASPGMLASGKTNAPRHIAVFALAELGYGTAEIHRLLRLSRRDGGLADRREIRRLLSLRTRAANS